MISVFRELIGLVFGKSGEGWPQIWINPLQRCSIGPSGEKCHDAQQARGTITDRLDLIHFKPDSDEHLRDGRNMRISMRKEKG
jgi:hypothetical protein